MDKKLVCINIENLYNTFGNDLMFNKIKHTEQNDDDNEYFDLIDFYGTLVCMDGEEVFILDKNQSIVFLLNQNGENDCIFALTRKEFNIATGGQNNG